MADIRLTLDEVRLCVKNTQLILHGVRRDAAEIVTDHVDIVLPWSFQPALSQLTNLEGINHELLNDQAA